MDIFKTILDEFFSFQAYVMLPFFIFIIAMLVRMNISRAFISSLKMGVGFAGIFMPNAWQPCDAKTFMCVKLHSQGKH